MKKPKKPIPKKLKRNPHARALGTPLFKPKVEKGPDEYRRRPRHRKPPEPEETGE